MKILSNIENEELGHNLIEAHRLTEFMHCLQHGFTVVFNGTLVLISGSVYLLRVIIDHNETTPDRTLNNTKLGYVDANVINE